MAKRQESDVAQLKIRLREPLRARLAARADERGLPLNAEIIDRLENSDAYGGPHTQRLLQTIAGVISLVEQQTGKPWSEDERTLSKALTSVFIVLRQLRTKGVETLLRNDRQGVGIEIARLGLQYAGIADAPLEAAIKKALSSLKRTSVT